MAQTGKDRYTSVCVCVSEADCPNGCVVYFYHSKRLFLDREFDHNAQHLMANNSLK